jgi:hypothetical protein
MADYYPLIARAVDGLGKSSTGEARRTLYERARAALVAQLRAVEPALSESEITRERLALEEAIRKVESDALRKVRAQAQAQPRTSESRSVLRAARLRPRSATAEMREQTPLAASIPLRREPPGALSDEPPPAEPAEASHAKSGNSPQHHDESTAQPTARSRLLNARTSSLTQEGLRGFRDVVSEVDDLGAASAKPAQSAREARDLHGHAPPQPLPEAEDLTRQASPQDHYPPQFDADRLHAADHDTPHLRSLEPSYDFDDEQSGLPPRSTRPQPPRAPPPEDEYEKLRPPRSYHGLAKYVVLLILLGAVAATASWQWPNIKGLYQHWLVELKSRQSSPASQTAQAPASQPKFSGRVPQEQGPGQPAAGATPGAETPPAVAQRVVLYEEDPNNPQGKRYVGSVIWRTETVSPGPGLAPELAVRADISIPEKHMTVTWSLRRNTDKALPASHTIEIMFHLPADFPGGGIANVPGILMKDSEQARGTPLAGLAVKVTDGYFLIGLSAVDADVQRNVELLKDKPWFDIPVVYSNGNRAILAMEKGPPGDRAFAEAFTAWQK